MSFVISALQISMIFICFVTLQKVRAQDTLIKYHPNGQKSLECLQVAYINHGPCLSWYPNGQLWISSVFDSGELAGTSRMWYDNGLPQQFSEYSKGLLTRYVSWHRNGRKSGYYRTAPQKTVQYFWSAKGKRILISRFLNGHPVSCNRVTLAGDTSTFIMPPKYPCGMGNRTVFITNNIPYDSAGNEVINKFRGRVRIWDDQGRHQYRSRYRQGQLHGKFREWGTNGKLKKYEIYKKGKLVRKVK
jgi:antitoxin component YwqK of YwqJK toxin-antitoxin module